MYNAINVRMRVEDVVEVFLFPHVHLTEFRSFARDELDPVDHLLRRVVEIICNHDLVVRLKQG